MEIFSTIDLVNQCLIDKERIIAFKRAIFEYVNKKSVVLEIGTGSGILSLFAAKAGAKKVYTVEVDPFIAKTAMKIIKRNDYEKTIKVFIGDASKMKFNFEYPIDIIISELLTTGMVDEQQVKVLNNLNFQKIISSKTKIIPCCFDTTVQLIKVDYNLYDFKLPMVRHLWNQYHEINPKFEIISNKKLLNSYQFYKPIKDKFTKVINFKIKKNSVVNGLLLESKAWLTERIKCTNTIAFLAPVIFPINEKEIAKGTQTNLEISYWFGQGYQNFQAIYK